MSRQVILDLPKGVFSAHRTEPAELTRELRLAAAVKWFELGRLFNNDSIHTSAVVDRVLHRAETVVIEGKSHRMKDQITEG